MPFDFGDMKDFGDMITTLADQHSVVYVRDVIRAQRAHFPAQDVDWHEIVNVYDARRAAPSINQSNNGAHGVADLLWWWIFVFAVVTTTTCHLGGVVQRRRF